MFLRSSFLPYKTQGLDKVIFQIPFNFKSMILDQALNFWKEA